MRMKTVEQIIRVVETTAQQFSQGYGIDHSYQIAVNQVSQEYDVEYQTIGDACCRRLDLDHIGEFKKMLRTTFEGDPNDLLNLLLSKTSRFNHERIEEFFSTFRNGGGITATRTSDTFVSYTIQLRKGDSDVVSALSQLRGVQPEEILAELVVEVAKEHLKQAVSRL